MPTVDLGPWTVYRARGTRGDPQPEYTTSWDAPVVERIAAE